MRRFRSPSLFVTFAGWFLAVLLLGTLLHGVVVVHVVRPLLHRWEVARAEVLVQRAARDIETALDNGRRQSIGALLGQAHAGDPSLVLVFHPLRGRAVFENDMRPPFPPRWVPWLVTPDSLSGQMPPRHRADSESSLRRRPRPVARQQVRVAGEVAGEVVAFELRPPPLLRPPHGLPFGVLLFAPVALLLAVAAALVLFRVFLRRVRALETMTTRVADGDLAARVSDPGADEIGRLGATLNRMAERLEEARRALESTDRERRRLFADITHELATPLTTIRGFAETLLDEAVPVSQAEQRQYLDHIRTQAQRMDALIAELLDLTRLEAGAAALQMETLDWNALCRNTLERYRSRFQSAGLELQWTGPASPAWVQADGRRLEQVIDNLLRNALRYVPRGGRVTVSIDTGDQPAVHRLHVDDNGPGFPAEDLPHVFERFYRGRGTATVDGTGLGLAIVQEIARRHGGRVEAHNRAPHGASLVVELAAASE